LRFSSATYKFYQNPGQVARYAIADCTTTSLKADSENTEDYEVTGLEPSITVANVSVPVKTLFIDAAYDDDNHYELDGKIVYSTSESSHLSYSKSFVITAGYEKSKHFEISMAEDVTSFRVVITNSHAGNVLKLKGIALNERIPFDFSFVRLAIMAVPAYLIFFFLEMRRYQDFLSSIPPSAPFSKGLVWRSV
jgi:hypothetical protein